MENETSDFYRWSKYFLLVVTAVIVFRLYVLTPYVVEGISMEPTLENNERIVVNKFVYLYREPSYGDVIVLHATKTDDYIKRVIGVAGDTLELTNGILYRNGREVNESYISQVTMVGFKKLTVPAGSYFVMGDNRNHSLDSREIGFIKRGNVVGKAELIFYPFDNAKVIR